MKPRQWKYLTAMPAIFICIHLTAQYTVPEFVPPSLEKTESGYIKLSWRTEEVQPDTALIFELQQADNPDFAPNTLIYRGKDYATFISGLPDGNYYYRLRCVSQESDKKSDWSRPKLVLVEHHALRLALLLFGIGATVFLLTVGIVIKGIRSSEEKQDGTSI
jgi:hypothetical protein